MEPKITCPTCGQENEAQSRAVGRVVRFLRARAEQHAKSRDFAVQHGGNLFEAAASHERASECLILAETLSIWTTKAHIEEAAK